VKSWFVWVHGVPRAIRVTARTAREARRLARALGHRKVYAVWGA